MTRRYHIQDPKAGPYAVTAYGASKREALNTYRRNWYPERDRLPKGVSIWQS